MDTIVEIKFECSDKKEVFKMGEKSVGDQILDLRQYRQTLENFVLCGGASSDIERKKISEKLHKIDKDIEELLPHIWDRDDKE